LNEVFLFFVGFERVCVERLSVVFALRSSSSSVFFPFLSFSPCLQMMQAVVPALPKEHYQEEGIREEEEKRRRRGEEEKRRRREEEKKKESCARC
jgi:hypothetical protein